MSQKTKGKGQKKGAKAQDLKQYMADDFMEEEKPVQPVLNMPKNPIIEEEDDENLELVNLPDQEVKERLNKENMDKISDVVVTMIFKNVT